MRIKVENKHFNIWIFISVYQQSFQLEWFSSIVWVHWERFPVRFSRLIQINYPWFHLSANTSLSALLVRAFSWLKKGQIEGSVYYHLLQCHHDITKLRIILNSNFGDPFIFITVNEQTPRIFPNHLKNSKILSPTRVVCLIFLKQVINSK